MSYKFLCVLTYALGLSLWKYEEMESEERDLLIQRISQKGLTTDKLETPPTIVEERAGVLERKKTKPGCTQNQQSAIKLNLKDDLVFQSSITSGSFPLGTVFVLILIHICGVSGNLVAAVSRVSLHIVSAEGLIEMGLSFSLAVYATYKLKCEKAELEKNNKELQNESLTKAQEHKDMVNTVMEVRSQLENWRNQLKLKLEEVEREREGNKKSLQSVENKITQKDISSDKPEDLLRDKEMLLWTQWKLDQTKKDTERHLLNTEKLMEPVEFQLLECTRRRK